MWFGANILTTRSLAASNSAKRFGEVLKGVWSESRVNQRTYHEMLKCKEVLGVPFACGTQVFFTHCPLFVFLLLLSAFMFCTFVTFSLVHRFHYGLLHCLNSLCYIVLRLVSTSHSLFEGVCHMYLLHLFFFYFRSVSQFFYPKVVVFIIVLFLPHSGKDSTETTCMTSWEIIVNWKKSCFCSGFGRSDWSEAVKCVDCFCAPT